jgi:hypothetical protein
MMGFFDKLNPFHKKEKSPELGSEFGKDALGGFGADMGTMGSQSFPDAWNAPGMDSGMGGMGQQFSPQPTSQPSFGSSSSFSPPPQQSFQSPSSSSFSSQPSFSSSYSQPSFSQPAYGSDADYMHSKNLEVIASKIDALRAAIDSMNARLQNIERIAGQEEENRRKRYY